MNCECMFIAKENSLEAAKSLCDQINKLAEEKDEEVIPTYISQAVSDFKVTPDYDGFMTPFKVKAGQYFIWAYGKDYCMYRLKRFVKGGRMCFPYALNPEFKTGDTKKLFVDLCKCE